MSSATDSSSLRELSVQERREFLKELAGRDLSSTQTTLTQESTKANIENLAGEVQVPFGLAGPVEIEGEFAAGRYYVPLATTEGALVASVNRGFKAAKKIRTAILKDAQTRAPVFSFGSENDAKTFVSYVDTHFDDLKKVAEETSNHLTLEHIECIARDNLVWLRLSAQTGEAMGMNMITIAADAVGRFLSDKTGAEFISVSGNLCVDKKPAKMTVEKGRGKSVVAQAAIPFSAVKDILKTTPEKLIRLNTIKNHIAAEVSGSLGKNAHHANIVAALYLATGQDLGHVVEGSLGTTDMKIDNNELHVTVTLPAIQVGAIGGGTGLPAQKECLQILKNPSAKALAEIVAATVLAGELSLLAAEAEHHVVDAHRRLNR